MKNKIFLSGLLLIVVQLSMLQAQDCDPAPIIVSRSAPSYCAGINNGFVYIENPMNDIIVSRWEFGQTVNGPWTIIPNFDQDTNRFTDLSQTTYYRAFVQRINCPPAITAPIAINIDQPPISGNISGAVSACQLFQSGNLTLTGHQGNITAWQRQSGDSDWESFGGTIHIQFISNITQTTNFRAIVQNGVCPTVTTPTASITIHPNPIADFNFTPVCLGSDVQFFNNSDGAIAGYSWIMGDGIISYQINPTRRYLQAGVYSVTLTVTTDQNCKDEITKSVEVYHLPVANFSAPEVCLNDTTIFRNFSTSQSGEITHWSWNFGDLGTSSNSEPKHRYAQPGEYKVSLFVRTQHNCTHTAERTATVNPNPTATFQADTVCIGNATNFYNLSSVESGYILRNQWSFGDGTSTQQPYPNKTYQSAGEFLVRLIVESEKQCKDTTTERVRVRALPVADFSATEVCDGETTLFQNSSVSTDEPITYYQWNFGDGSTSSQHTPSKLYLNPEVYVVGLLVRTGSGCEHQIQKQAIVHRNPIADFMVQNVCVGDKAEFVNQSFIRTSEFLYYQWDLGDGNQTQFQDFTHVYEHPGDYAVSLKVTSSTGGCVDSTRRTFRIYPLPHINAGEDITTGRGIPAQLSVSGGVRYHWFPVTGLNNSTIANPVATLNTDQTYVVFGTDAFGCENTDTVTVFIIDDNRIVPTNFVSPNSGGGNSYWIVQNIENYPEARVTIFDVSGFPVYNTTNYQNNWDGRNQNGEALPDGTYYYLIAFPNDNRIYKGAILVLRKR